MKRTWNDHHVLVEVLDLDSFDTEKLVPLHSHNINHVAIWHRNLCMDDFDF